MLDHKFRRPVIRGGHTFIGLTRTWTNPSGYVALPSYGPWLPVDDCGRAWDKPVYNMVRVHPGRETV